MGPAHFGVGFAVKTASPKVPLWVYLVASELLDLLSFVFMALGVEHIGASRFDLSQGLVIEVPGIVPYSHGLFMSFVWSFLAGGIVYLVYKERRGGVLAGLVVFSHWVLDFIVHAPDLPVFFEGSPVLGLGLWTSGPGMIASMVLEVALLGGGIAVYAAFRKRQAALKVEK